MNNRKIGRPKLDIEPSLLKAEITKYLAGDQKGVQTYRNLGIGKTSFYRLLQKMEVKKKC